MVPVQVVYLGREGNTIGSEAEKENSQLRMFIKQLTTWAFKRNPTGKSLEAITKHMLLVTLPEAINLDSKLKSRDITLSTKVRLVKATVFPVVMYGCES